MDEQYRSMTNHYSQSAQVGKYRIALLLCFVCMFSFTIGLLASSAYADSPIYVWLVGTKTVEGAPLRDGQFDFAVHDKDAPGAGPVATATNDAQGHIAFSPIEINSPGVYTYLVSETTPSGNGWTTDDRVYTVTVRVDSIVLDYDLEAEVEYPEEGLLFHNIYRAADNPLGPNNPPKPGDNPSDKKGESGTTPGNGPGLGSNRIPAAGDAMTMFCPLAMFAVGGLFMMTSRVRFLQNDDE